MPEAGPRLAGSLRADELEVCVELEVLVEVRVCVILLYVRFDVVDAKILVFVYIVDKLHLVGRECCCRS